jgi:hypothetical protein
MYDGTQMMHMAEFDTIALLWRQKKTECRDGILEQSMEGLGTE